MVFMKIIVKCLTACDKQFYINMTVLGDPSEGLLNVKFKFAQRVGRLIQYFGMYALTHIYRYTRLFLRCDLFFMGILVFSEELRI